MNFMKVFLLFFFVMSSPSHALLHLGAYGGIGIGDGSLRELESGEFYQHDYFSLSGEVGLTGGVQIAALLAGVVASRSWNHLGGKKARENGSVTEVSGYNNTLIRNHFGLMAGFDLTGFRLWGEYYPLVNGEISYAGPESANVWVKNEELEGTGFGLGLGKKFGGTVVTGILIRRLYFDTFITSGVSQDLPNAQFTEKFKVTEVLLHVGLDIDVL